VSHEVAELAQRVQQAAAYMARIGSALKGKHGLEEVEALLAEVRGGYFLCRGLARLQGE